MFSRIFTLGVGFGIIPVLAGGLAGCGRATNVVQEPAAACWFADISDQAGLHFVHDAGPTHRYFMPQSIGSGAALFDFDNDGRLDIYLVQNGGPKSRSTNRLFHQESDGRFTDVSAGSGLDIAGYGMGVAIGDVNNDGWPDVLVTEYGGLHLFLNNGNGTFTDVTKEAGLDSKLWSTSAAFVDYDRDGWLDLVVANYVSYDPAKPCGNPAGQPDFCPPQMFEGTITHLYRNLGMNVEREARSAERPTRAPRSALRAPRFEDVTLKSGLARAMGPGLGVICADFNGDRWPDIFVANDGKPNHLWINQHNGTFKEEAVARGLAYNIMGKAEGNMGIAVGDVDGDGLFDVFITHLVDETNRLWKQGPRGVFQDRTAATSLASPRWRGTGFGTLLADFDHDGALDLAVVNGAVTRKPLGPGVAPESFWSAYSQHNQLFVNDGKGIFRDVSESNVPFCGAAAVSRGLACGDIDNDGGLDLLVTTIAGPARLYRNVAPKRGHWLTIRALNPALKRDAYGAEIVVHAADRQWLRWINPGHSYLCSNDPRAHFGLGSVEHVERIDVIWPDGSEETFPGQAVDRFVVLSKGSGSPRGK